MEEVVLVVVQVWLWMGRAGWCSRRSCGSKHESRGGT